MSGVEYRFELTKAYYRCLQIRKDYSLSTCDPRKVIICALTFEDCVASRFLGIGGISSVNCHRLIPLDSLIYLSVKKSLDASAGNVQPFFDAAVECAAKKGHRVAGTEHLLHAVLLDKSPFQQWTNLLHETLKADMSPMLDMRMLIQRFLDHSEYPEFASGSLADRAAKLAKLDIRTQSAEWFAVSETIYFAHVMEFCKEQGEV